MADDLSTLITGLDEFARELADEGMKAMFDAIGMGAKEDVADAVKTTPVRPGRSLADQSMSGWRRGKKGTVGKIVAEYKIEGSQITIRPMGNSTGQMRVLEDGRKAHAAGSMRNSGTYTSKKTGAVRQKTRKVTRQVHPYPGKGTWARAMQVVERESVARAEKVLVRIGARSLY